MKPRKISALLLTVTVALGLTAFPRAARAAATWKVVNNASAADEVEWGDLSGMGNPVWNAINSGDTLLIHENPSSWLESIDIPSGKSIIIDGGGGTFTNFYIECFASELTLRDIAYTSPNYPASALELINSTILTIIGNVSLTCNNANTGRHGIESFGLTITGTGTLTAKGSVDAHGIYSADSITINAPTLATGGDRVTSRGNGIYSTGNITINAPTTATGGDGATSGGNGIYATDSVTINAPTTATGGNSAGSAVPPAGLSVYAGNGISFANANASLAAQEGTDFGGNPLSLTNSVAGYNWSFSPSAISADPVDQAAVSVNRGTSPYNISLVIRPVVPVASVAGVTISGRVGSALSGIQTATITLTGEQVISGGLTGQDAAGWFTNLPPGISVTASAASLGNTITLTFGGTPQATSGARFDITIPASVLMSGSSIAVTANANANFNITRTPAPVSPLPRTGDEFPLYALLALLGVGLVGMGWLVARSRKRGGRGQD